MELHYFKPFISRKEKLKQIYSPSLCFWRTGRNFRAAPTLAALRSFHHARLDSPAHCAPPHRVLTIVQQMKKLISWVFILGLLSCSLRANPLPKVKFIPIFRKLAIANPTWMCWAPGDSSRAFLLEQQGRILVAPWGSDGSNATEFLNITNRQPNFGYEDGLLGMAFHPNFQSNHLCYIYYSQQNPEHALFPYRSVLSELKISAGDPNRADLSSERVVLEIPAPFMQHKAGMLAFGPDGYLYIGVGDGGMGWDPYNNAQNPASLLGKILRIDVNRREPNPETNKPPLAYGIPADNPFVNEPSYGGYGARHEIYAWGLRNPWRFSFDRQTGDLWAGDVGQDLWEEIDLIVKGGNYGWCAREGAHYFKPAPEGARYIDPVMEYPHQPKLMSQGLFPNHSPGMCVTGGYVYRGKKYPSLQGVYLYADFALGTVWGFRYQDGKVTDHATLLEQPKNISSFAEDNDGELYAIALDGHIYSIVAE